MNNFENITTSKKIPNEQTSFETAQSMREIDELQITTDESLREITDYLDEQKTPLTNEQTGVLLSIGETFKKSKLLKAAALAVTFMSAQGVKSSFAEDYSVHLRPTNSRQLNVDVSDFNNPTEIQHHLRLRALEPGQLSINGKIYYLDI